MPRSDENIRVLLLFISTIKRLPPKWIELNITKRECDTFIAIPRDETLCQCGRRKIDHGDFAKHQHRRETWSPTIHTRVFKTDAYGTILFEGEHHPNKAHYARLSYDTNPELIVQLMTYVWNVELPKLVISIRGGSTNFDMPPRIGKIFQGGLMKAAKSTNAWIFSNGLNCGAAKHLGCAMSNEKWLGGTRRGEVVAIGITPWGMIENRNDLIGKNKDRVYSPLELARSKFLRLNPRHSNYLLVDNGSLGKFGGENYFRRRFEKCISSYQTGTIKRSCDIPVVVVVIEGGFYTLRQVSDYLHDNPPVPVVIFAGTGRSADLIAWVLKKVSSEQEYEARRAEIYRKMMNIFRINTGQCPILFKELKNIYHKRNLITVFNPSLSSTEDDFDSAILSSIFRSQHWTPLQQLSLTLVWDRVDIAHNEVFIYGREWSRDHLEHAMMEALTSNRLEFVHLLLEHGLNMQTFLTASRLESLYWLQRIPGKLMRSLFMEFAKIHKSKNHLKHTNGERNLTLHEIGMALTHMLGHIYKSNYIHIYANSYKNGGDDYNYESEAHAQTFPQPFDDLFVWAVLTKRHEMSKLLWSHGKGALAKSLVAVRLNKYLAHKIKSTETSLANEAMDFEAYAEEWESLSVSLLDMCYRSDNKMARQLLTMELDDWSKQTCLTLAVVANHRMLLGHPCSQTLLKDLWLGALNIKANSTYKIILGILFPPCAFLWEYKSTEELKLLPHQEKNELYGHGHKESETKSRRNSHYVPNFSFPEQLTTEINPPPSNLSTTNINPLLNQQERKTDLAEVVKIVTDSNAKINQSQFQNQPQEDHDDSAYDAGTQYSAVNMENVFIMDDLMLNRKTNRRKIVQLVKHSNADKDEAFRYRIKGLNPEDYSNITYSSFVTTHQSLTMWNKFVEFQKAPVTNFYRHTIAYCIFIVALAYVILYPQDPKKPGWIEWYVIGCFITQFFECIREFIDIEELSLGKKICKLSRNVWQFGDLITVTFSLFCGLVLRFTEGYYDHGMLVYRVSSIYWNMRLYKYLGAHRFVGPKIVMMWKMMKHMVYFSMIILVVIISFGMARESIRFPDVRPGLKEMSAAFLEPYVMMFGEVDLGTLSLQCGGENDETPECPPGYWIVPAAWVFYMLVANILIVNVLIAVFNGIYEEIDAMAVEIWMFQRFNFVMEFEQKPILPPPLIIICHIISLLKYFYNTFVSCMCDEELLEAQLEDDDRPHIIMGGDHSLKSFLSPAEQCMVFDFEEDNMDNMTSVLHKNYKDTALGGLPPGTLDSSMALRTGSGSDKFTFQHMKQTITDLHLEMEVQRNKLDKLVNYWEMELANTLQEDEDRNNSLSILNKPSNDSSLSSVSSTEEMLLNI